jgi:hypothetical protein
VILDAGGFGGFFGWGFGGFAGGLGRDFEAIFVHIESLFAIEAFDEFAGGLGDGSGKTRGIYGFGGFDLFVISVLKAKLHLKRFHVAYLPFLTLIKRQKRFKTKPIKNKSDGNPKTIETKTGSCRAKQAPVC